MGSQIESNQINKQTINFFLCQSFEQVSLYGSPEGKRNGSADVITNRSGPWRQCGVTQKTEAPVPLVIHAPPALHRIDHSLRISCCNLSSLSILCPSRAHVVHHQRADDLCGTDGGPLQLLLPGKPRYFSAAFHPVQLERRSGWEFMSDNFDMYWKSITYRQKIEMPFDNVCPNYTLKFSPPLCSLPGTKKCHSNYIKLINLTNFFLFVWMHSVIKFFNIVK